MPDNTRIYPDLGRHLCAARALENARQHPRLPRSCSKSMCCESLRECPTTHAFTPILFDIYVLREPLRMPGNTRVYPDLVRHLCAARALENARQHTRLPRSGSTSMCCDSLRECPTTHAFTPILFDIYVLREPLRMPDDTLVYPDLVRHLCAARALENARQHTHLPRSCSTSMCCESLRECPTTHAFTPILFDIYVLREP